MLYPSSTLSDGQKCSEIDCKRNHINQCSPNVPKVSRNSKARVNTLAKFRVFQMFKTLNAFRESKTFRNFSAEQWTCWFRLAIALLRLSVKIRQSRQWKKLNEFGINQIFWFFRSQKYLKIEALWTRQPHIWPWKILHLFI